MRFLDANVFVYAYHKPGKQLGAREGSMKERAKEIIRGVSEGKEEVLTSVVHVGEVVNVLKHGMPLGRLVVVVRGLFMLDTVKVVGVSREVFFAAVELGEDLKLEANDALTVDVMRSNGVREIYSFDEDFDRVEGIVRLPQY
jgi:hypothetical protein